MTDIESSERAGKLRVGDYIEYRNSYEFDSQFGVVAQHNYRNVWIGKPPFFPPNIIKREDVVFVYTLETNPEYFL